MLMTSVADQSFSTDVESGQGEGEDVILREYESGNHPDCRTSNREMGFLVSITRHLDTTS